MEPEHSREQAWGPATRAIHVGQEPEPTTGAVVAPIFQTSTFTRPRVDEPREYSYSRTGNPTRTALAEVLASLEGAEAAVCFASGVAAEDAVLRLLEPGDRVVLASDLYGGTWRLADTVHRRAGISFEPVALTDLPAVSAALDDDTRLVWAETPSNPTLEIVDLAALAEITHAAGARLVVDNTFATPALQRPLEHGADIVVHSTTKYLGGHSDALGGAVCTDAGTARRITHLQHATGAVPGPLDAWLTLRGVKTLQLRMARHGANAGRLADMLSDHPRVAGVGYPGLRAHPGHALAARQMDGFGGMLWLRVAGGRQAARRVAESTRLFFLAGSLGGVESLIEHPASMSHAAVRDTPLAVPEDLLRLSVGIEDVEDLARDLDRALG